MTQSETDELFSKHNTAKETVTPLQIIKHVSFLGPFFCLGNKLTVVYALGFLIS